MTQSNRHILIIQTAFIGDAILSTSLIESISKFDSKIKIDILVRKGNESLVNGNPKINRVLIWDKSSNKYKNLFSIIKEVRKTGYDKVINLQRFAATGIITALSKAKNKIGFKENPFSMFFTKAIPHDVKSGIHEVERNQHLIADFCGSNASKPRLYPTEADFNKVQNYKTEKYICIAPTSVWFTKQYPEHKWVSLIESVPAEISVFLLGAPSDFDSCESIVQNVKSRVITNLAGKLTLMESAALIKNATMNYVNDSAPMHIASSMNAPTTAIYCSTIPKFGFGPLSDDSTIIETEKNLDCRPCGLHGKKACPEDHFDCAESVDISWK